MQPQTFVFIGRSGSGKGTQAELLIKALKDAAGARDSLYIQTGGELRAFIQGQSYTQKLAKSLYDTGSLMAEFLTIDMWVHALAERYTGKQHLVFDGTPRKLHEAQVFDSIFDFYKLPQPWIIYIDVGRDAAVDRLMVRHRMDDKRDEIMLRLSWFETEVVPAIEYFRANPRYKFVTVPGERTVDEVHADIVKMIGLR